MPKVVLTHANGLRRILGHYSPEEYELAHIVELDKALFQVGPKCKRAGLVSCAPKVIFYREIVE